MRALFAGNAEAGYLWTRVAHTAGAHGSTLKLLEYMEGLSKEELW